jgi:hypothetical protein
MKRLLLILVLPLVFALIPATIHADVSVVQDSCVAVGTPPYANVWTYFSVVNFSLPSGVCFFEFMPEPQPPDPGCVIIDTVSPTGWDASLNAFGGAEWFATEPDSCISSGNIKRGFAFYLDPAFCCYVVTFRDATGAVLHVQEECFTCQKVPVEERTWGYIKQYYYR